MVSNGMRRMAAKAAKIPSVNSVMGQGGDSHVVEAMPTVQSAMRQGNGKNGGGGVPSVQSTMRQGGGGRTRK